MNDSYIINGTSEEVDRLREGATEFVSPWYSFDGTDWAKAYLLVISPNSPVFIEHQFNDVCCDHAHFRGLLLGLHSHWGDKFDGLLRKISPDENEINLLLTEAGFNTTCKRVHGQGLVELQNDWFILTEGND